VDEVVCYVVDRFVRNEKDGHMWLDMLLRRGIDLQEAHADAPRPLRLLKDHYSDGFKVSRRASDDTRRRVLDEFEYKLANGEATTKVDGFGHQPVKDSDGRHIGGRVVPEEAAILTEMAEWAPTRTTPPEHLLTAASRFGSSSRSCTSVELAAATANRLNGPTPFVGSRLHACPGRNRRLRLDTVEQEHRLHDLGRGCRHRTHPQRRGA